MKRFLWIAAIVLIANAGALVIAARNRGATDASLQLTEREMRVTNMGSDTTGMTLTIEWDRAASMRWFDRAKLTSLGFDCSMPPDAPRAAEHYSGPGVLPRAVYVVFEYDPSRVAELRDDESETTQSSTGEPVVQKRIPEYVSRLRPVDAGNDPRALRTTYADRLRFLITAGTVRPTLVRASTKGPARLQGQVLWIDPIQVYVPQEMQATIAGATGKNGNRQPRYEPLAHAPRYEVSVEYGSRLLPRIVAARRITPSGSGQ